MDVTSFRKAPNLPWGREGNLHGSRETLQMGKDENKGKPVETQQRLIKRLKLGATTAKQETKHKTTKIKHLFATQDAALFVVVSAAEACVPTRVAGFTASWTVYRQNLGARTLTRSQTCSHHPPTSLAPGAAAREAGLEPTRGGE